MAADLPQVAILATGGTIAGTAASATQTTGYKAGDLAIQTLIDAVPQIKDYATVTGEQIVKISSNNLTDQVLLKAGRYLRCIGNGDLSWAGGRFYAAPYHVVREDVILVL